MSSKVRALQGFVALGSEAPFLNPFKVVIVGLDVPETPDNWFAHCPRLKHVPDADLDDYLARVRATGRIEEPIDVYRDGDRVAVLDGRSSTRVARMLWKEQAAAGVDEDRRVTVRALIRCGSPEELFRYNVESHCGKRELTPTQRARMVLNHYRSTGEDVKKTAALFNVTDKVVRYSLALFECSVDVQRAVESKELPIREAVKLADKTREEQKKILAELRAADATRGAAARNGVAAAKRGERVARDTARARPRAFVERWQKELRLRGTVFEGQLADALGFALGGPVPDWADDAFREVLAAAGYKEKSSAGASEDGDGN